MSIGLSPSKNYLRFFGMIHILSIEFICLLLKLEHLIKLPGVKGFLNLFRPFCLIRKRSTVLVTQKLNVH